MDNVKGLCERLRVRAQQWRDAAEGEAEICGEGTEDQEGMEANAEELDEAATALTSLSRELAEARAERDAMQEAARGVTYISKQATDCAGCGARKHTPLKRDEMGGYVCLACVDSKLTAAESSSASKDERIRELEAGALAEREACAREADNYDQTPGDDSPMGPVMAGQVAVAQSIAAAIRARSTKEPT